MYGWIVFLLVIAPQGLRSLLYPHPSHWAGPRGAADILMLTKEGFQFPDLNLLHLLSLSLNEEASPIAIPGKNQTVMRL